VDGEPHVTHDESYTDSIFGLLYCNISAEIFTFDDYISVTGHVMFFLYIFNISVPLPKQ